VRELLIKLLRGKEEAGREAWRLMILIYGPLLKKSRIPALNTIWHIIRERRNGLKGS